jgi:hypothetical protein
MSGRSGRNMTYTARTNIRTMLATTDLCWLCHHGGARTGDHIITAPNWLTLHGTMDGYDNPDNLAPAHGTGGNRQTGWTNPCPVCGQLCNQARGAKPIAPLGRTPW